MHRIPGLLIGEICCVEEVPDGIVEIPYLCEKVLKELETTIGKLVPDATRFVRKDYIEYMAEGNKVFLRVRFREKSLRLIMPGNEITFVDPHMKTRPLQYPEWGTGNVEYELKDIEKVGLAEEYLITSLALIEFFEKKEEDIDRREEFILEPVDGSYEGPLVDGKPHGIGKFTWSDGSFYEGSFIGGEITGEGSYTRANGDVFKASFINGRISVDGHQGKNQTSSRKDSEGTFAHGYIF